MTAPQYSQGIILARSISHVVTVTARKFLSSLPAGFKLGNKVSTNYYTEVWKWKIF